MPNKRMEGVPWPRRELADMELCEGTKGCLEPRWLYCQLPGASRDVIMHLPSLGSKYLEGGHMQAGGDCGLWRELWALWLWWAQSSSSWAILGFPNNDISLWIFSGSWRGSWVMRWVMHSFLKKKLLGPKEISRDSNLIFPVLFIFAWGKDS